jgi:hypothetical protein
MRITEDMIDAGVKAYAKWLTKKGGLHRDAVQDIYKAMSNARWQQVWDMDTQIDGFTQEQIERWFNNQ